MCLHHRWRLLCHHKSPIWYSFLVSMWFPVSWSMVLFLRSCCFPHEVKTHYIPPLDPVSHVSDVTLYFICNTRCTHIKCLKISIVQTSIDDKNHTLRKHQTKETKRTTRPEPHVDEVLSTSFFSSSVDDKTRETWAKIVVVPDLKNCRKVIQSPDRKLYNLCWSGDQGLETTWNCTDINRRQKSHIKETPNQRNKKNHTSRTTRRRSPVDELLFLFCLHCRW